MLKKILAVGFCIAILYGFVSCQKKDSGATGQSREAMRPIVLKAGHVQAPDHAFSLGLIRMGELLKERTNGLITIDVFPSSQLGGERELAEACQLGTVDLGLVTGPMASFDGKWYIFDIPGLFLDKKHAYKFMDGPDGQEMLAGLSAQNIKGLSFWEVGFLSFYNSRHPFNSPEDMRGLNIRTMENTAYFPFFTAVGANPVPMAFGETFTALQNGTIDGNFVPIPTIYTNKFYTVAKYVCRSEVWYCPATLCMSQARWDSLSPEMQEIVQTAADEAKHYMRQLLTDGEEENIRAMVADGAVFQEVDKSKWFDSPASKAMLEGLVPSLVSAEMVEKVRAMAE